MPPLCFTSTHNTFVSHDLPLDQDIHPIPVKEGNSKGSAFCIVSSTQVARQVIAELDGKYTIPGFGGMAPVNVKVSFYCFIAAAFAHFFHAGCGK